MKKIFALVIGFAIVLANPSFAEEPKVNRINAAKSLTDRLDSSVIRNFQIRVHAKGKNCDIMHVETLNLLPPMMEALANGKLIYGQAIPGGINNFAQNYGFKSIFYTSRADESLIAYGNDSISSSEIKKMQACSNQTDKKTSQKQVSKVDINGKNLIEKIHKQYKIHSFYSEPVRSGSRMVIWLPEAAWNKLTENEKSSIRSYMKGQYSNCGIGIGRVDGVDIISDKIIPIQ